MRPRAAGEDGFGLIELLIAMTILSVALLALAGGLISSANSMRRAGHLSTATTLADMQTELYRALKYECIRLDPDSIPSDTTYTSDTAYSSSQITAEPAAGACPGSGTPPEWDATRDVTGATSPASPDGHAYRVDTYITWYCPAGTLGGTDDAPLCTPGAGDPATRAVKRVTVVVRDGNDVSTTFARVVSTFDASTGL
jgi:prepilin-type N-terminal cleavage/methylation domain-containing protein